MLMFLFDTDSFISTYLLSSYNDPDAVSGPGFSNKQNRPTSQFSQYFPLNGKREVLDSHGRRTRSMSDADGPLWRNMKQEIGTGLLRKVCVI